MRTVDSFVRLSCLFGWVTHVAVSGHPLLYGVSVEAARNSRFSPTTVDGKPVKVTGVITYNFVSQ